MSEVLLVDTPDTLRSPRIEDLVADRSLHAEKSVAERAAAARLKECRRLHADSLRLAGYDLARLGICRCGNPTLTRKKHCAECAPKEPVK